MNWREKARDASIRGWWYPHCISEGEGVGGYNKGAFQYGVWDSLPTHYVKSYSLYKNASSFVYMFGKCSVFLWGENKIKNNVILFPWN